MHGLRRRQLCLRVRRNLLDCLVQDLATPAAMMCMAYSPPFCCDLQPIFLSCQEPSSSVTHVRLLTEALGKNGQAGRLKNSLSPRLV